MSQIILYPGDEWVLKFKTVRDTGEPGFPAAPPTFRTTRPELLDVIGVTQYRGTYEVRIKALYGDVRTDVDQPVYVQGTFDAADGPSYVPRSASREVLLRAAPVNAAATGCVWVD